MKYLLIIIALACSQIVSAQNLIQTDTTKDLKTAQRALMEIYQSSGDGHMNVQFDNSSTLDLKTILNLDMKASSPTYNKNLLLALAYMDKKEFKLISTFSLGEYHTKFIFERK